MNQKHMARKRVLVYGEPPPTQVEDDSTSTQTGVLLLMLLLVFLCMIALVVTLCRVGRIERSLDMMTLMQRAPMVPAQSYISPMSYAPSYAPSYYPPPPYAAPPPPPPSPSYVR